MLCDIALLLRILAERVHTAELASGVAYPGRARLQGLAIWSCLGMQSRQTRLMRFSANESLSAARAIH